MQKLSLFAVGIMLASAVFAIYIPKKEKSETSKVSIRLDKLSDSDDRGSYWDRFVEIKCQGDNRNTEDVTVSVGFYLIGKNSKGLMKLLKSESTSSTMKKFTKKNDLGKCRLAYRDYKLGSVRGNNRYQKGADKRTHFEYRGCLVIVKGPDGKIITIEGEYAKLYTFIEAKGEGDIFDSKGNEKDVDFD